MKIAESWLREWVDPDLSTEALGHQLTMLGHEVEGIANEGEGLDGVVVAEVIAVDAHPDADRLGVCKVDVGTGAHIDVVCGAPNVVPGMKSPMAMPGVQLPNGVALLATTIRGVASNGMLCSAVELGLGDESDGIVALPADAPIGAPIADYLNLPDAVFDLDLTPNRGDCFCVLGVARDIAALTGADLASATVDPVPATIDDTVAVELLEPAGCPIFAGRVIRGIDPDARSPLWMAERLRRAGLRSIHPVVDVTNYVMLEFGQPLHAYDLGLIQGGIRPRLAKKGEKVTLLDEREIAVNEDTLVISDDSGAIGLAGIMGGLSTAVSQKTVDVFFEAAFWPQEFIAGRARSYAMHTDASMRFERGVDPSGQERAIERATALLLGISGGKAGPLEMTTAAAHIPKNESITLRRERIKKVLGADLGADCVTEILERLRMDVTVEKNGWTVVAPSHRFDIGIEADLIEEVARLYGYDRIPESTAIEAAPLEPVTESEIELDVAASVLVARDYQEVLTYSFVDVEANTLVSGSASKLILSNPISSEMSAMRTTLWTGMLGAAASNVARQQERVRLFEIGKSFHGSVGEHDEVVRIAALAIGSAWPEQWGRKAQAVDFFDIKSDVTALLRLAGNIDQFRFEKFTHSALQPGQCANILRGDQKLGVIGKLHPNVLKHFDIKRAVFVFELDAVKTLASTVPAAKEVSRFPAIRRDIAVVVDENISASELAQAAASAAPELIEVVKIFDIYQGPGIEAGRKSVALGLILQETSRTLTDDDADSVMAAAVKKLQQEYAADLRD